MSSTPLKIKREVPKPVFLETPRLCKFYTLYPDMDRGFTSYRCDQPATQDGYCIFHSPSERKDVKKRFKEVLEKGVQERRCVFVGYRLPGLKLEDRIFEVNMHFSQAKINFLEMKNCVMKGFDLSDAEIGEIRLHNCELIRLNLSGASVRSISIEHTRIKEFYALWSEIDFLNVQDSEIDAANFSGIRSRRISFSGGVICGSNVVFTDGKIIFDGESLKIREIKPFSLEVEDRSIPMASFADAEIDVLSITEMDVSLILMAKGKFGRIELRKVRLPEFNGKKMLLDEILALLGSLDREDLMALKEKLIFVG